MPDAITAIRQDGRTRRADRTRATIMEAARVLMCAGNFRPTIRAVAAASGCSVRTIFEHYYDVDGMQLAALDGQTVDAIAALIAPVPSLTSPLMREHMAHAAVFGRPIPTE